MSLLFAPLVMSQLWLPPPMVPQPQAPPPPPPRAPPATRGDFDTQGIAVIASVGSALLLSIAACLYVRCCRRWRPVALEDE